MKAFKASFGVFLFLCCLGVFSIWVESCNERVWVVEPIDQPITDMLNERKETLEERLRKLSIKADKIIQDSEKELDKELITPSYFELLNKAIEEDE